MIAEDCLKPNNCVIARNYALARERNDAAISPAGFLSSSSCNSSFVFEYCHELQLVDQSPKFTRALAQAFPY
jgi:hypothetical protein